MCHASQPILQGAFDSVSDALIFKATFGSSFSSIDFGNLSPLGLSEQFVLTDISVMGSFAVGGALMDADLVYIANVPLQPGDANQDLQFDQSDLIQVLQAGTYLTGAPSTWGQGDWNGAPGGGRGSPPAGDAVFDQKDVVAALQSAKYLTGAYAAILPGGVDGDEHTSIVYNSRTGEIAVDVPANNELTSINIDSATGIFTIATYVCPDDCDFDHNIFKATRESSFGDFSWGNAARTGLTEDFVLNDLTVIGSLSGGGQLGDVDLIYIPEPSCVALLAFGALAVIAHFRRNQEP